MKIKVKLRVWVGLLFTMIVALAVIAAVYINRLKKDTSNILKDNYSSLEYCRNMLNALDVMANDSVRGIQYFANSLARQKDKATEPGEMQSTDSLYAKLGRLQSAGEHAGLDISMRRDINNIMLLNMRAIQNKSSHAADTAEYATFVIIVVGTTCFIIAFILLFNLPGNIANPIHELTNSIRQIAAHNYQERVHFEQHNEFGMLATSFNIMAEKLEEYSNSGLSRLLTEKKRIEALIDNMKDPVIGLDADNRVLFINNEAIRISGLSKEKVVGKEARDIALENDLVRNLVRDVINPSRVQEEKKQPLKIFADNKESYFEKEIIPIEITPTGENVAQPAGHVILLRNITPFKELDLAKTNFIATVSHELKTPIASIKMGLQLLDGKKNDAEEKGLVQSIREEADRLLKITGELLNMTQAESGNIKIQKRDYALDKMITYALDTVRVPATQKNITLHNNIPPGLTIHADEDKTTWVITNFLTNSIRYSPEHTSVNIEGFQQNGKTRIAVTDEGPGIEKKYREKIFERYFKIPGTSQSGTGLGLSICREFIEAQGGTIGVYGNESGVGSTFYFEV